MGTINDINEFEKYLSNKQKADTFSFYGILIFLVMGIAIVTFAVRNKKLKNIISENDLLIKELQDEKTKRNADLKLTLDSLRVLYNLKMDSIQNSFAVVDSINRNSFDFQKMHYENLLSLAESKLKKTNSNEAIKNLEAEKTKAQVVIKDKENSNSTKIEDVRDQAKINKIEQRRYNLFIQYMSNNKSLANSVYDKALRYNNTKVNTPEQIVYSFTSVVKYFNNNDRTIAERIGRELGYRVILETSKYEVPLGQIEIWIGN